MHTPHGLARLVGFSDGVVAIAITLLILPLVESVGAINGNLGAFLAQNSQLLFAFVLSFAVIGNFWLVHHQLFERVAGYNAALLMANLLWLLSIVFLPFPTAVLAAPGTNGKLTYALYIGTLLVTTAAGLTQQWILIRNPDLQTPAARGTLRLAPLVVPLAIMILALILATTIPGFGLLGLVLLFLSDPVRRLFDRARRKQSV